MDESFPRNDRLDSMNLSLLLCDLRLHVRQLVLQRLHNPLGGLALRLELFGVLAVRTSPIRIRSNCKLELQAKV